MAKADGLLGKLKGKVGGLVFYEVDGIVYVRQYVEPKERKPSPLRQHYKNRFGLASHFLRYIKIPVEFGFQAFRKGMRTGMNVAMGYTAKNAVSNDGGPLRIEPAQVMISRGSLTGALNAQVQWKDEDHVRFSWENNSYQGSAKSGDRAMVLLYNEEDGQAFYILEGLSRGNQEQEIEVSQGSRQQGKLHAYLSFHRYSRRNKTREFSDSQYLGMV